MKLLNFDYEGAEIPFRVDEDGEVFMNATAMVKLYPEKRVNNFLRKKESLSYVNALHRKKMIAPIEAIKESPLIQVVRGKTENQGSWFHEDVALVFAQYISDDFYIWCNDRIKDIMNKGFSAATEEATDYIKQQMGSEVRMTIYNSFTPNAKRTFGQYRASRFTLPGEGPVWPDA